MKKSVLAGRVMAAAAIVTNVSGAGAAPSKEDAGSSSQPEARLPLPGPYVEDPAIQMFFAKMREENGEPINLLQALAYNPEVIGPFSDLADALRKTTNLNPADRELVILRTVTAVNGAYEIPPHRVLGEMFGLTPAQINDIGNWKDSSAYDERQRALLAFVDESLSTTGVSDDVFLNARRYQERDELVTVVLVSGLYSMAAQFTRSFQVPSDKEAAENWVRKEIGGADE